jgi:transcriptional regulator with XRE-family HTH domain
MEKTMIRTAKKIQNYANCKALRKARELKKLSRKDIASRLKISVSAIEKYERGADILSEARIVNILKALEIYHEQFIKLKRGKGLTTHADREKRVLENTDRRSYQKNITKECRILRSMRREKGLSQDHASLLCGYARAAIGHIENGRIEISKGRIEHIIKSYGFSFKDFEGNLNKDELRDQIIESCIDKINSLDDTKLSIVKNLLGSL